MFMMTYLGWTETRSLSAWITRYPTVVHYKRRRRRSAPLRRLVLRPGTDPEEGHGRRNDPHQAASRLWVDGFHWIWCRQNVQGSWGAAQAPDQILLLKPVPEVVGHSTCTVEALGPDLQNHSRHGAGELKFALVQPSDPDFRLEVSCTLV